MITTPAVETERATSRATRVLVVEDHAIIREGVCLLLEKEPDITVIGSVGTGEDAISFVRRNKPDLVVMDLGLPGIDGLAATRAIKQEVPDVRVLILTMYDDEEYLLGTLDAGGSGYLLKQSAVNDLVTAVRAVVGGHFYLQASGTHAVVEALRRKRARPHGDDALTEREKDVLRLVGQGRSSKEIALSLCLSAKTVDNYRSRILQKLQANNSYQAVFMAVKQGIIEPPSNSL